TLLDSLSGGSAGLASTSDLYERKAILVIGADLAQQHPMLSFQIRANYRHHGAHVYTVTPGPVREQQYSIRSVITIPGSELQDVETLREQLKAEPELVILFGDAIKGDAVRKLVDFGSSLGIPVGYLCLLDYSNSRGASDMGLAPDYGPGYKPVEQPGLA